jgi:hypothetical protein
MGAIALPPVPAPPAGQPDPREALYFATAAELGHQYEHTLASDQEASADDKAAFLAAQGKLDYAEPTAQTNIRNKANAEGLATSGIEAQRADQQLASYTRARGEQTLKEQQDQDKINRGESEAGETYIDKMMSNLANAEKRQQEEAQKTAEKAPTLGAPAEPAAPAALPGVMKGINPPAGTIKSAPRTTSNQNIVRKAAAKRVTG